MNQKRPINLELTTFKFPPMAIASILHRISGVILFLLFPVILYFLSASLQSQASYSDLLDRFTNPYYKVVLWGFGAAIFYHALAGIRHILMDLGWGESLTSGRRSAVFVIALAVFFTIILGICIW